MVDLVDLGRVNLLANEKQSIIRVLELFSRGGRIVAFGVNPPEPDYDGPTPAVSVVSGYMEYPPQMLTQVTALLQGRITAIQDELTQMGVTGMDQAQPRGPPPPFTQGPAPGVTPQFVGPDK